MAEARTKGLFKRLGQIFMPLLPGFVVAGMSAGFASLLAQAIPGYRDNAIWFSVHTLLTMTNTAFTAYLSAWAGYSAALNFGATPILGGMLGMITGLNEINLLSKAVGLFSLASPAESILRAGSGGVMAIIFGVWLLSVIEKALSSRIPKTIGSILTPMIAFCTCLIPYVLVLMPVFGIVSKYLCMGIEFVYSNDSLAISLIAGYVFSALFLPFSLFGLQYAFIALYYMQLETTGSISLYPVLAMAGASQVGAAISVYLKAKRLSMADLAATAAAGIFPGMLGIGQALLYGVSVPHPKTFVTTCLGAGFGGAFIVATKVSSTGWGASGLLALPLMTAGAHSPLINMLNYASGLSIACFCGFLLTSFIVKPKDLEN